MNRDDPDDDRPDTHDGASASERTTSESGDANPESEVHVATLHVDDIISSLGNQQRRDLLEHLATSETDRLAIDTCATHVASQRAERIDGYVDPDRVAMTLDHVHLPILSRHEIVEWNRDAGVIEAGPRFDDARSVLVLLEDLDAVERQNERLDRFAKVIAHDLRNPLHAASGYIDLAQRTDDGDRNLEKAQRALERMETLIDDLQAIARGDRHADQTDPVELAAISQDCWRTVETAEATLLVKTDRTIRADAGRLKQVLENLFRNAVEHGSTSPASVPHQDAVEHGSTSPNSAAQQDAVGQATSSPSTRTHGDAGEDDGDDVTVTVGDLPDGFYVADDGPGIPPAARQEVFESGYSTTDTGTGLGLDIVRRIATAHGWEVRVTASEDGGARFEFAGVELV